MANASNLSQKIVANASILQQTMERAREKGQLIKARVYSNNCKKQNKKWEIAIRIDNKQHNKI